MQQVQQRGQSFLMELIGYMTNISVLIKKNQERWDNMSINPSKEDVLNHTARRLVDPSAKERYIQIETTTGVPWFIIAVIHERESGQDFTRQLSQGDPLNRVSVHEPQHRGPFFNHPNDPPGHDAFYRGALDALIDCPPHASRWHDWSPGGALTLLEEYNGLGYANRGMPSPYIWSFSNQYVRGKYVADGVFSLTTVDSQEGCAPLLKTMMQLDSTIKFGEPVATSTISPSDVSTQSIKENKMFNWKTTVTGTAAIFAAVGTLFTNGAFDASHLSTAFPAVIAGLGLIFAKDSNVTGGTVVQDKVA